MNFLTKKLFLYANLAGTIFIGTLAGLTQVNLCERGTTCNAIVHIVEPLDLLLFVPVILLPLAAGLCFLSNHVFEIWKKFAIVALPIVLILTFFITRDTGGSNFFSMDYTLYFLGFIYGLFFLASFIIIMVTSLRNR